MRAHGWRRWLGAGTLALAVAALGGCDERRAREDKREVQRELEKAGDQVRETAQKAADATRDAVRKGGQEIREGVGGAGEALRDADIGDKPGVVNDGEGPLEERQRR